MTFKAEFGPGGNMIYVESPWEQDFRFVNTQTPCRGICYEQTSRSYVYLGMHESINEIIDSCVHESIHMAIRHYMIHGEEYPERMDIDHEHEMMRYFMMAEDIL